MKITVRWTPLLVVMAIIGPSLWGQEPIDGFLARTYTDSRGGTMPYRLFIPQAYDRTRLYPLIIYLHGIGGFGTDNLEQISGGNTNGSHVWTSEKVQREHPAFVLVPQGPNGSTYWGGPEASELSRAAQMMLEIVGLLEREFNIDRSRIYLTGQSLGGFGTWDVIIRQPDLFAAAVPLCGSGVLKQFPFRKVYAPADFEGIKNLPIWVFQGVDDQTVPVSGPRETVATLRKLGSTNVKYTEYAGVGHNVWEHAYLEPALIEWLFAQRRE